MGYQVFPQPSTSGASLPPGGVSLLVDGLATKTGFTYTSSSISAGNKLFYANAGANNQYHVYYPNSKTGKIVNDGAYTVIGNTTTESQFSFSNITNPSIGFSFTTNSGRVFSWTSQAGLLFVMRGTPRSGVVRLASDGLSWTSVLNFGSNGTAAEETSGVVFGNGVYLAFDGRQNAPYWFSTNGTNWVSQATKTVQGNELTFYDGQHFAIQSADRVNISTDGLNWTSYGGYSIGSRDIASNENGGVWVMIKAPDNVDNTVHHRSTNKGQTWTQITIPGPSATTGGYYNITYGNGFFVAGGSDSGRFGVATISTNGTTWTQTRVTASTSITVWNIYFANGLFISGAGTAAGVSWSVDGVNWSSANPSWTAISNFNTGNTRFIWDGQKFMYAGVNAFVRVNIPSYYAVYNMSATNIN